MIGATGEQNVYSSAVGSGEQPATVSGNYQQQQQQQPEPQQDSQQDVLKSKLLIGEFVVLSQNYSHSKLQQSLLAENLVKLVSESLLCWWHSTMHCLFSQTNRNVALPPTKPQINVTQNKMDQVFLSTDVRHVYSRMEVKKIR